VQYVKAGHVSEHRPHLPASRISRVHLLELRARGPVMIAGNRAFGDDGDTRPPASTISATAVGDHKEDHLL
jgi:hypothetical protein